MAETWKAQMLGAAGVTRPVVIKRILPSLASDKLFIEGFVNEARVSALLNHGNIAQVLEFGELDGQYFLAMEFVHGRTLEQLIERAEGKGFKPLPAHVACFVVGEVLKALHYAHTRTGDGQALNIVHRDVSPDNVLIGFDGQVKLTDFGVAKAKLKGRTETEPGLVKGKWLYFSPEQAAGKPLDGRSDVFAAGIVLYRCLCGRLPFEGQPHQAMLAISEGRYPPPRTLAPNLDAELVDILRRALAREVAERFQSAAAMGEALQRWLMKRHSPFTGDAMQEFMHRIFEEDLEAEGVQRVKSAADPLPLTDESTDPLARKLGPTIEQPAIAKIREQVPTETDVGRPTVEMGPNLGTPTRAVLARRWRRSPRLWAFVLVSLCCVGAVATYVAWDLEQQRLRLEVFEKSKLRPLERPAPTRSQNVVAPVERAAEQVAPVEKEKPRAPAVNEDLADFDTTKPRAAPKKKEKEVSQAEKALAELEKAYANLVNENPSVAAKYKLKVRGVKEKFRDNMSSSEAAVFVGDADKLRALINKAVEATVK
jgi:eukaryotic-like serine/threonine-protein kinase